MVFETLRSPLLMSLRKAAPLLSYMTFAASLPFPLSFTTTTTSSSWASYLMAASLPLTSLIL